jgi:tRNA pseudouridine38-40 synthase
MPRYRLTIEYDGGPFCGFQMQAALPTVQGELQRAVEAFCGEAVVIHGAGRTDTGVHATGQVIHFDLAKAWPADTVRNAMNAHLRPQPVAVIACEVAEPDFHARFSAKGRRYLYRILNRAAPAVIERGHVWLVKAPMDAEAMDAAAQVLVGHHDFTTFRDVKCQAKSPLKTMDRIGIVRERDEIRLEFAARSFLHRQVRSMTGSIAEVGIGRWTADDLKAALQAADRTRCAQVAPSDGLYLTGVEY